MEAPSCRVCGNNHYGMCAGLARPSKRTVQRQMDGVQSLLKKHGLDSKVIVKDPPLICPTCGKKRNKTDDPDYMKNYMRARRRK